MLVEIIMTPFWVLIEGLVSLLPSMSVVSNQVYFEVIL